MKKFLRKYALIITLFLLCSAYLLNRNTSLSMQGFLSGYAANYEAQIPSPGENEKLFGEDLAQAAFQRTKHKVIYDGAYVEIAYPGGDVPSDRGVCTDVVIRSLRSCNVDLQQLLHEDMQQSFMAYPKMYRHLEPDSNIDHRRVPNLMTYFQRHHLCLPCEQKPLYYQPGDIVAWDLGGGLLHIGIVVKHQQKLQVVHNIGAGPRCEEVLFDWQIIGHYRLFRPMTEL